MKKLSIIIPHYNSPDLLRNLLNSIPNINDIEVIVVDDKSDKFINEYEILKNDFRYINFYDNNGIKSAGTCRNIGLDMSVGEWVLFADADDYFTNDFYEIVFPYFSQDFDMVFFKPVDDASYTGNRIIQRSRFHNELIEKHLKYKTDKTELKLKFLWFVPWSRLIKRSLILENNVKFDEVIACNDAMFSAKIGNYSKKISASCKKIYYVTTQKGSLARIFTPEIFDIKLSVNIRYYNYLKDNLSFKELKLIEFCDSTSLKTLIINKASLKQFCKTISALKKGGVPFFNVKLFSPNVFFRFILHFKENKKYTITKFNYLDK